MRYIDRTAEPAEGNFRDADEGGTLGIGHYLQVAKRRAAVILLTAMTVTVIVVIVVRHMPNKYRAETVILVDPQEVPGTLVPSIITSSVSDRLSTIQQEVTSPTRLQMLVHSMNLFGEMRKTASEHQVIAEMQKSISIQVVDTGGRGMSAFRVGFSGKNPAEVAEVANRLAELFITENLKLREKQSYGTAEFLEDEQKRTKEELEHKESELNGIKSKYVLDLPDSKQYHQEALATLRNQLQASQDRVNRAQQQKVYLQSLMSTQAPTVDLDAGRREGSSGSSAQTQKLEAQLSTLRARYGDNYPDVKKVEAELREATEKTPKQQAAEVAPPAIHEAPSSASTAGKNPVLVAQIVALDDEIAKAKTEQQALEQQIAFHEGKLQKIPLVEQRISGVMRDYDSLRAHYTALENKKLDADTASALETHEKGERFHVLDRAMVPTQPFAPKRTLISLAGLLAGLVAGLGLAVLLEVRQGAVHTKSEVLKLAGETPILATIPMIHAPGEIKMRGLRLAAAFLITAAASVAAGTALSYLARNM
jgi:polysaccharide chain length determinant protein (PEP-CTERM system associated)